MEEQRPRVPPAPLLSLQPCPAMAVPITSRVNRALKLGYVVPSEVFCAQVPPGCCCRTAARRRQQTQLAGAGTAGERCRRWLGILQVFALTRFSPGPGHCLLPVPPALLFALVCATEGVWHVHVLPQAALCPPGSCLPGAAGHGESRVPRGILRPRGLGAGNVPPKHFSAGTCW